MSADRSLTSGVIGYAYRWLRNGGVVAVATGSGLLGYNAYRDFTGGQAVADVMRLEITCEATAAGKLEDFFAREVDCAESDRIAAGNPAVLLREVKNARLTFHTQLGEEYNSSVRLTAAQSSIGRGDRISILYNRDNPTEVRLAADKNVYMKAIGPLGAGLAMLSVVFLLRRAWFYSGDVNSEIADLEHAYRQRVASRR